MPKTEIERRYNNQVKREVEVTRIVFNIINNTVTIHYNDNLTDVNDLSILKDGTGSIEITDAEYNTWLNKIDNLLSQKIKQKFNLA